MTIMTMMVVVITMVVKAVVVIVKIVHMTARRFVGERRRGMMMR
tara:strand:+ start:593 stop:724 length:132 start_codon:yes stop_codon:yes gene_type:complete